MMRYFIDDPLFLWEQRQRTSVRDLTLSLSTRLSPMHCSRAVSLRDGDVAFWISSRCARRLVCLSRSMTLCRISSV